MPTRQTAKDLGSPAYQLFLLAISIYVLAVLLLESFVITDPEVKLVLQYIDFAICLIFFTDFLFNLVYADNRLAYLKWGWIDLVASIPAIDPLRWGRLSRVIRILRFLRSIKSLKVLFSAMQRSKIKSLTLLIVFTTFLTFSLSAALILEFERDYPSGIDTASESISWCTLNLLNAKVPISAAHSSGGIAVTVILNKVGLLLFAYVNAIIIAWLLQKRNPSLTDT